MDRSKLRLAEGGRDKLKMYNLMSMNSNKEKNGTLRII